MKPNQVIANDLRECSAGVVICREGDRYILGTSDHPIYIEKLVYSDLRDIIKRFDPYIATITTNNSFVLMGVTNQPKAANANHFAVVFIEKSITQQDGKSADQYAIRCIVTNTVYANFITTLYYDSNRRNICSINGNNNEILVIQQLPHF